MNELPNDQESRGVLLLTAQQVAKLLQISKRSLWRLVSAGKMLRPVRLGRSVRWRADELKQWIASGCPAIAKKENKGN